LKQCILPVDVPLITPIKGFSQALASYLGVHDKIALTIWDANDDNEDGMTYDTEILALDRNEQRILVGLPPTAKDADRALISILESGLIVGMVVNKGPVQVLCYPVVDHFLQGADSRLKGIWCRLPEPSAYELHNRRRHIRVPMTLPVMVDWYKEGLPKQMGAYSLDVSGQGIAFNAKRGFEPGQRLQLTFQFRRNIEKMCLDFQVISSIKRPHPTQKDHPFFTGGSFINLSEGQEKLLVAECFRKQTRVAVA